jgi:hypothetical protein
VKTLGVALVFCMFAAGCGGGGASKPQPISGAAKDAADVVLRLEKATERKDFTTICDDLLASATRKQAGGDECAAVLGARVRDVRHPRIKIQSIELDGARAQVKVKTTADGQAPASDVIRLVRENGQFRVISLGR